MTKKRCSVPGELKPLSQKIPSEPLFLKPCLFLPTLIDMKTPRMRMWNREKFIAQLDSGRLLPSLSPLTLRLMQLSSDENCSLIDIAGLIEKDASLTIRILRLANSAFFKPRYPISTVRAAVLRIGIYQTRLLALSLSLKDTFSPKKIGAADYRQYWRVSLYQGLIARFLSQESQQNDPEEAFTAALCLEIGLLVFLHIFLDPDDTVQVPSWYPLPSLLEWETGIYGVNHREIGELLLAHWGFPSKVVLCQRSHQFGHAAAQLPPLARCCAIASQLSAAVCQSQACLPEVLRTMEQVYGLSQASVLDAVTLALAEVDSIAQMFDVEIDSEEDRLELMRKAHDSLAQLSQRLLEGQTLVHDSPFLADLNERPGDRYVRHTLQTIEHEIRNPLTVVGGFARRLARTIDPTSDQGEYVRIIMSEADRLEQALNGIGRALRQ